MSCSVQIEKKRHPSCDHPVTMSKFMEQPVAIAPSCKSPLLRFPPSMTRSVCLSADGFQTCIFEDASLRVVATSNGSLLFILFGLLIRSTFDYVLKRFPLPPKEPTLALGVICSRKRLCRRRSSYIFQKRLVFTQ